MTQRSRVRSGGVLGALALLVCTLGFWIALPAAGQVVLDGTIGDVVMGQDVLPGIDNLGQDATYLIHDGLGELSGPNLYFSFDQFSIGGGETATFMSASPVPIDFVMSRVTGGSLSQINGTLRSTIPGADLFLINPAGVAFGAGSSLDIPRSLHITTADYLRYTDGTQFLATAIVPTALSTAPIDAFGFMDAEVGTITVQDTRLELRTGQTLSLVGGDIEVLGYPAGADPDFENRYSAIRVPSGRVNLAAVASAGEVVFDDSRSEPVLDVSSFDALGNIRFAEQASLTVNGNPGGTVVIRGHDLEVSDDSSDEDYEYEFLGGLPTLASRISIASVTEGDVDHPGLGLDIDLRGDLLLENASLHVWTQGEGRGGDIRIRADGVSAFGPEIFGRTDIGINSWTTSSGAAGGLELEADRIDLFGRLSVGSKTFFSSGSAGDLTVIVRALTADGGLSGADPKGLFRPISNLSTTTRNGSSGQAGDLMIHADEVHLINHGQIVSHSLVGATGNGGSVTIDTRQLEVQNGLVGAVTTGSGIGGTIDITVEQLFEITKGGIVTVTTFDSGAGGLINITADQIEISGGGSVNAQALGSGPGGLINITVDQLFKITEGGSVELSTFGSGAGGSVGITADQMIISGGISARAEGSGSGGSIDIMADKIKIGEGGFVGVATFDSGVDAGNAGTISITADQLFEITEGGYVNASTSGPGLGGSIHITADQLEITEGVVIASTSGAGAGGTIDIKANRLTIRNWGAVSSVSCVEGSGCGAAGDITITAEEIALLDFGTINTTTVGARNAGNITIRAGSLLVSGVADNPLQNPSAANPLFTLSSINSATIGSGDAGNVAVVADQVRVLDSGRISSATLGSGAGGNVTITSDDIVVSGVNSKYENFLIEKLGLDPKIAFDFARSVITSRTLALPGFPATGDAGIVQLRGGAGSALRVENFGRVSSSTNNKGAGGSVDIDFGRVLLSDGGSIDVRSTLDDPDAGDAGGILINTQDFRMVDATVSVGSIASDAGDIEIHAANGIELFGSGSTIEANVGGGAGTSGGNVELASDWVVIDGDSSIVAQAGEGNGGNIEITTQGLFAYPGATISVSSEFGLSGTVQVNAPDTNLTSALAALSDSYQDEIALARNRCAMGGAEERGSFVLGGYAGIPEAPDAPLPSYSLGGGSALQ